jgi:hypothetical protein
MKLFPTLALLTAAIFLADTPQLSAQTLTLVIQNQSGQPVSVSPQLTTLTDPKAGTATLSTGTTPVVVSGSSSNNQVTVTFNATAGPVSTTLQVNGAYAGTPFTFIQVFGSQGVGQGLTSYNLSTTRPFTSPSVFAGSGSNYTLTLTIPASPVVLPEVKWSTKGTVVQKDGVNYFAKGVCYSPTPLGGATFAPGVGDWFVPPWWTYDGINSPNDIGARDIPLLKAMGVNSIRTYFTWYWMKKDDLNYLSGITQDTPLTVFTDTQYPYTVFFDRLPFLDACYRNGISVVIGIALEGGNCFNYNSTPVRTAYQNFYLQTAIRLATLYGNHPAVMGFCMGNEQNQGTTGPTSNMLDSRTYLYYQQMYQAIKAVAPDKLVTIAFQDDGGLYNGTARVTDKAGQQPPTPFNNIPVEKAISTVVDVWGLNIYSGLSGDFPIYEKNVVSAANGSYARPLWVTEWGVPSGGSVPAGALGPPAGNARAETLNAAGLAVAAESLTHDVSLMHPFLNFIAGAYAFEFTDEWWKNASLDPTTVNTAISPYNPATGMFAVDADGKVTLLSGEKVFPTYPFIHDGSASPDWPEESWGLFRIAVSGGRSPISPDPNKPDTLTANQPMVDALQAAYEPLATDYAAVRPGAFRDGVNSGAIAASYGHVETPWGVASPSELGALQVTGLLEPRRQLSEGLWQMDPFGLVDITDIRRRQIALRLKEWGNIEAVLDRRRPNTIYFPESDERQFIAEDAFVKPPRELEELPLHPMRTFPRWPLLTPLEQVPIPDDVVP